VPGFEPLAHAVPQAIAALLRTTPMSPGKLEFAWKIVVGPAMERGTSVLLDGRTLRVDAKTTAWAKEVTRSSRIILKRLQTLLGAEVISELVVRV
jgi:predicted nucleic acid-binding Zn ribbon protein